MSASVTCSSPTPGRTSSRAGPTARRTSWPTRTFDDTYDTAELKRAGEAAGEKFIHHYQPHVEDWRPGDPTWEGGKGKGIIGALNYLASKGMNSVYFLT